MHQNVPFPIFHSKIYKLLGGVSPSPPVPQILKHGYACAASIRFFHGIFVSLAAQCYTQT